MQILNLNQTIERIGHQKYLELFYKRLSYFPGLNSSSIWLCGGAVRDLLVGKETHTDFDFFFNSLDTYNKFIADLCNLGASIFSKNEFNTTLRKSTDTDTITVQCINLVYPSIEKVLDSFDFTITQFGFDGINLYCGDYSLYDLARKRLALNKLTYGVSTLRRLLKYSNKGFTACPGVLSDILNKTVENPQTINGTTISLD